MLYFKEEKKIGEEQTAVRALGEGVRGASLRENMKWKIKKRNCVVWEDNVSGGGSDRKMFTCLFSKQKTPHGNISG